MSDIYLQGNGVPCYNPDTGNFYRWSEACCADCTACVERKSRGAGNANAPYGYKCEVFNINEWAAPDTACSQTNCELYVLSYVVQENATCSYIKSKAGGIGPHVPDACSVVDADNDRYISVVMSYTGGNGLITVKYHWGGAGAGSEIVYTKPYPGVRIPCLDLDAEKIDYVSHTWGTTTYCDPTASYVRLTDL